MKENFHDSLVGFDGLPESSQKKIDQVVQKVLDILENREDLQEQFQADFREMYIRVLSQPDLLEKLLDGIEGQMMAALTAIEERFKKGEVDTIEATIESKATIKKYTIEALGALKDSLATQQSSQ